MNIKKITIAGAGTMGYSMAEIFARKGYDVILWNHREQTLEKAKSKIACEIAGKIAYSTDLASFTGRDLVIENIAENLDIKLSFYREMSPLTDKNTIIATNTSGLSINTLSKAVECPERFLGMHWFNPPTLIPLIEIIKNEKTLPDIAQAVYDLSLAIDKKPALVEKDVPGFAANRIQLAVVREVCSMVEKGIVSVEAADSVMKYGLGFRWACLGPLETLDFGGLDIFYHVSEYLMKDLEDSHEVPELLKQKFEAGELGVKSGKGFYDYSNGTGEAKTKERDKKLKALNDALYK